MTPDGKKEQSLGGMLSDFYGVRLVYSEGPVAAHLGKEVAHHHIKIAGILVRHQILEFQAKFPLEIRFLKCRSWTDMTIHSKCGNRNRNYDLGESESLNLLRRWGTTWRCVQGRRKPVFDLDRRSSRRGSCRRLRGRRRCPAVI